MGEEILFRVIIVGDTGVGKSCLLLRFSENIFKEKHDMTIGVEFGTKTVKIGDSPIKLQIWDTTGQEKFRSITRSFYRRADGVLLVYDATAKHTFDNCKYWIDEIRQNASADVVMYLVSNQVDLIDSEESREVTSDEGIKFAERQQLGGFKETSAKNGLNVEETFIDLTRVFYERWKDRKETEPAVQQKIELRATQFKKKKKCC